MSPTVSFWDCGEFIACSKTLSVPHPPGAPVFILIGRIFTMVPFVKDIALRMNVFSALCSAITVMVLYLIIVRLIREWKGYPEDRWERITIAIAGVIGALGYAFTDSFWFSAVEAEVYAMSIMFTALVLFFALYWMDNYKDYKSVKYILFIIYLLGLAFGIHLLSLLVIPTILILIYFTQKDLFLRLDLWLIVPFLIVISVSIYALILIRSSQNPPLDMNNPENWENFKYYINREQYGSWSIIDRRAPFWVYQTKKMFLRYFGWQFIGHGTTIGSDGYIVENFSLNGLKGLPFIIGIAGFFYHFMKDWKRAFSIFVLFIMTGFALIIYLNQPDPQPRERDYVYVGCFLAFSIWIGMGSYMILNYFHNLYKNSRTKLISSLSIATLFLFLIIPVNELRVNFHTHDRSGNYMPWDYSYNILQSCEKDAILFTNGDNDTYPLWYLQIVEGIRTDVSLANLSLMNTDWYILQLKQKEPRVPINIPDNQIKGILPVLWEKKRDVVLEIPIETTKYYLKDDFEKIKLEENQKTVKMNFAIAPTLANQALRVQDRMILDILLANQWQRPLAFSITTPFGNMIGLNDYMRMDGMAWKIVPNKNIDLSPDIIKPLVLEKYKFRGLDDPKVFLDHQSVRLLGNYRNAFINLALSLYNSGRKNEVTEILDKLEKVVPSDIYPIRKHPVVLQIAKLYLLSNKPQKFELYMDKYVSFPSLSRKELIEASTDYIRYLKNYDKAENILIKIYNEDPKQPDAISYLVNLYERSKNYKKAIEILDEWLILQPKDNGAKKKREAFIKELNKFAPDSLTR